jgi:transcriptional regulator with XRE-family HTH domain
MNESHKNGRKRNRSSPVANAFAATLRAWRLRKKLRQAQVAASLNVSKAIVSDWELAPRFPALVHLEALAVLTGMSVSKLLRVNDGKPPKRKRT